MANEMISSLDEIRSFVYVTIKSLSNSRAKTLNVKQYTKLPFFTKAIAVVMEMARRHRIVQ